MSIKEFLRMIEEIYSYRFDFKSVTATKKTDLPPQSLQEAAARLIKIKMKTKVKSDQSSMDFISSIDYHRQNSVEADLFYRFFSKQYAEQDLLFFLFERSLVEREQSIKLSAMPTSFDIRTKHIPCKQALKIAKVYFQNISGSGPNASMSAENLSNHFVSQLIKGAQETQESKNQLYDSLKSSIQVTFFLIKLLREF